MPRSKRHPNRDIQTSLPSSTAVDLALSPGFLGILSTCNFQPAATDVFHIGGPLFSLNVRGLLMFDRTNLIPAAEAEAICWRYGKTMILIVAWDRSGPTANRNDHLWNQRCQPVSSGSHRFSRVHGVGIQEQRCSLMTEITGATSSRNSPHGGSDRSRLICGRAEEEKQFRGGERKSGSLIGYCSPVIRWRPGPGWRWRDV
jgi:hypothetical protein